MGGGKACVQSAQVAWVNVGRSREDTRMSSRLGLLQWRQPQWRQSQWRQWQPARARAAAHAPSPGSAAHRNVVLPAEAPAAAAGRERSRADCDPRAGPAAATNANHRDLPGRAGSKSAGGVWVLPLSTSACSALCAPVQSRPTQSARPHRSDSCWHRPLEGSCQLVAQRGLFGLSV